MATRSVTSQAPARHGVGSAGRSPHLDGLRGMAILLVVLFHGSQLYRPEGLAGEALAFVLRLGWSGVDLFFVLSGFLITGILLESRRSAHFFRNFYARRALRIVPVYYALLLVLLVIVPQIPFFAQYHYLRVRPGSFEPIWYWLFLSNAYIAFGGGFHHATLAVTWSLAIEEQFYLVWPLVVRWVNETRLLVLAAAGVVLSPVLRTAALARDVDPLAIFVLTPFRVDGLAFGALVALLLRRAQGVQPLSAAARLVLPGALLGFAVCSAWGGWPTARGALFLDPLMQTCGLTLLLSIYACLLTLALDGERRAWTGIFAARGLRVLGKYSYAMYLLHGLVNLVLDRTVPYWTMGRWQIGGLLLYLAASLGVTLLLARASWAAIETPFLRLKRHFPYGSPLGSASTRPDRRTRRSRR